MSWRRNSMEDDIWSDFVTEMYDNLEVMYDEIEKYYRGEEEQALEAIARILHNVKGTSAALGQKLLSDITHHIESLFIQFTKDPNNTTLPPELNLYEKILNDFIKEGGYTLDTINEYVGTIGYKVNAELEGLTKIASTQEEATPQIEHPHSELKREVYSSWASNLSERVVPPQRYVEPKSDLEDFKKRILSSSPVQVQKPQSTELQSENSQEKLSDISDMKSPVEIIPTQELPGRETQIQLIYCSKKNETLRLQELASIYEQAVHNNQRDNISGMLLYYEGQFFQVLEGPSSKVNQLYAKIVTDERHQDVELLDVRSLRSRRFQGWSMSNMTQGVLGQNLTKLRELGFIESDLVFPRKSEVIELFLDNMRSSLDELD